MDIRSTLKFGGNTNPGVYFSCELYYGAIRYYRFIDHVYLKRFYVAGIHSTSPYEYPNYYSPVIGSWQIMISFSYTIVMITMDPVSYAGTNENMVLYTKNYYPNQIGQATLISNSKLIALAEFNTKLIHFIKLPLLACGSGCQACKDDDTSIFGCTQCKPTYVSMPDGRCTCQKGYYDGGQTCLACPGDCLECFRGSSTKCDKCPTGMVVIREKKQCQSILKISKEKLDIFITEKKNIFSVKLSSTLSPLLTDD